MAKVEPPSTKIQRNIFRYTTQFFHLLSKVKQSNYSPWQALRVSGGWGFQISKQGCQSYTPTAFTPQELFLVLISVRGWVNTKAIVWPEGLCQWKIPVTPLGIKPATFRLVAQCLNQLHDRVPPSFLLTVAQTDVPKYRPQYVLLYMTNQRIYNHIQAVTYPGFFRGKAGGFRQDFFSGGVQQIQLTTEGRENGDLWAVAP
jgi:hypothetical protein